MKRTTLLAPVVALGALAASAPAHAVSWGFTHQNVVQYETRGFDMAGGSGFMSTQTLPTLDLKTEGWTFQIAALDTIASITREEITDEGDEALGLHFAFAGYKTVQNKAIKGDKDGGDIKGVIQPGAQLVLDTNTGFDHMQAALLGGLRMGAQATKGMGFGMYVIPQLGFASVRNLGGDSPDPSENTIGLAAGGMLQVSVWTK